MGPSSLSGRTSGVTVQGLGDDNSKACGSTVSIWIPWTVPTPDRLSGSHLWRMTHVALPLDIISNRSVASFSVHFLYKYHTLLFSFLHFPLKHIVRALLSSLLENTPFSFFTRHQRPSSVHLLTWWVLSFSQVFFTRLYTPITPSRPIKVLGFIVPCRQYLAHQVTNQLSATRQITRKYTR